MSSHESDSAQPVARISLNDLRQLFLRAFGHRRPIDLTDDEMKLADRVRRAMQEAK